MAQRNISRYWRLAACCAGLFCTAGFYIWSVFANPLVTEYGWSLTRIASGYSLQQIVVQITTLLLGGLLRKIDPRKTYIFGIIMFAGGWFLAGCAKSETTLILAYSLIAGIGNGSLYITATSTGQLWFPDKRGLASGCILGCAGIAPLLWAPLGQAFLEQWGPSTSLKLVAALFFVVIIALFWLMKRPPEGWVPEGWSNDESTVKALEGKSTKEMLKDPVFYLLFVVYACAATAGNMVMGHGSNICQTMGGLTAMQAATMVGVLSVASFLGRLILATASDKIGRVKPLFFIVVVTMLMCVVSYVSGGVIIIAALLLINFCFGGSNTVMNATCGEMWGNKYAAANWSFLYIGYSVAAVVGPTIASLCYVRAGSYTMGFMIAAVIEAVALAALILASSIIKKRKIS